MTLAKSGKGKELQHKKFRPKDGRKAMQSKRNLKGPKRKDGKFTKEKRQSRPPVDKDEFVEENGVKQENDVETEVSCYSSNVAFS